jgi:hypothetical protein
MGNHIAAAPCSAVWEATAMNPVRRQIERWVFLAQKFRPSSHELQNAIPTRAEELYRPGGAAESHDVEKLEPGGG